MSHEKLLALAQEAEAKAAVWVKTLAAAGCPVVPGGVWATPSYVNDLSRAQVDQRGPEAARHDAARAVMAAWDEAKATARDLGTEQANAVFWAWATAAVPAANAEVAYIETRKAVMLTTRTFSRGSGEARK